MFVDLDRLKDCAAEFKNRKPFDHLVIDEFFEKSTAQQLERDVFDYDDENWFSYSNAIEEKKALNNWNYFPSTTYKAFQFLTSQTFSAAMSKLCGVQVTADQGLHGGGWHIHASGGNLNPHLDYSLHPKTGLQRKLNIIVYLSSDLEEKHGGHLGLWAKSSEMNRPGELVCEVAPKFNRAIIFDTTQTSWHGMSRKLSQPSNIYRKSIAAYYLCDPPADVDRRERALFAPRSDQLGDKRVEDLIVKRADSSTVDEVYREG